jgi:hypothetical protein
VGGARLWLAAAVLLLAGCTRVEIEDHSLQFNQATGSLANRLMLLNVVRASKGYPVQFSKVANYSGQSRIDGGLNLNIPFIGGVVGSPNTAFPGSVGPNATVKSGVSQLQLADLSTAEFQRTLRRKVTANDFAYYRSQGWPAALVHTLLIEEILLEPGLRDALAAAAEKTCDPDPKIGSARRRKEKENQQICRWLRQTIKDCAGKAVDPRASPEGDIVYAFQNDPHPDRRCHYNSFQWFFAAIRVLPAVSLEFDPKVSDDECTSTKALLKDLAKRAKGRSKDDRDAGKGSSETVKDGKVTVDVNVKIGEKADKDEDASDKSRNGGSIGLNLPKGIRSLREVTVHEAPYIERLRQASLCLLKEGKTPIIINWRSPERMVRYLGEVLAAQDFGSPPRKMVQILNDRGELVDLLRVERGSDAHGRAAAVSVEGPEGESFHIPIPDRAKQPHLSLQALALVMESVNLAISGKELPRAPTLFLSGG